MAVIAPFTGVAIDHVVTHSSGYSKPMYTLQFKTYVVELAQAAKAQRRPLRELAKAVGVSENAIRTWIAQHANGGISTWGLKGIKARPEIISEPQPEEVPGLPPGEPEPISKLEHLSRELAGIQRHRLQLQAQERDIKFRLLQVLEAVA